MVALPQLNGLDVPWTTIGQLVADRARTSPDREAVTFPDSGTVLTCADLDRRSDAVAASYAELGVVKGDRVAALLLNSVEQLVSWIAAAKLGAVAVMLNVSLRDRDLRHALSVAAPSIVLVGRELADGYESARSLSGRLLREIIVGGERRGYLPFAELERRGDTDPPRVEVDPADPACVVFTGGTTGLPKGVIRPHFSYLCAGARYAQAFQPTSADRHYSAGQLFHIGGQESAFIGPLMNGVPTAISAWFSASRFWPAVRRQRATIIEAVGSRIMLLLRQPTTPLDGTNDVRVALAGTRDIPPSARAEFARRFGIPRLVEVYAMTETGSLLFFGDDESESRRFVLDSHGWCEARVTDARGVPSPPGHIGEILLRPTVAHSTSLGYLDDPASTVERWRDLWVHTGDLGRLHPGGRLEFVGRQAHWLRRRGENVSALEVEQVLDDHPDVVESAIVATPSELGEDDLRAVVVPTADRPGLAEELFDWCERRLAYFKVPRFIELRSGPLPRTATKREIERHVIRDQAMTGAVERVPRNPRHRSAVERTGNG
ncbi:AMP-binding protein [Actinophytocola sp.]|uniref:AMP-binding protein n=1 Tax=Actinophytocola sp. TaxID=1872138 RepID=UPI003D6BD2D1